MFGKDFLKIYTAEAYISSYMDVFFYIVENDFFIVKYNNKYYCSCNKKICWHTYRIKFNQHELTYCDIDIFPDNDDYS